MDTVWWLIGLWSLAVIGSALRDVSLAYERWCGCALRALVELRAWIR